MLSLFSRLLTYVCALLYAITGVILFLLPEQIAPVFAWKVTPFMTMTIGAWALGNAWLALITALRWKWQQVYTSLIYLWTFGLLQTAVVIAFRDKLNLSHPIAWLYLLSLAVNVFTAVIGVVDALVRRPAALTSNGPKIGVLSRISVAAFILFVGFLALYGTVAPIGWPGTNAGIFPEVMTLFTLRAFAAFYLSLTIGVFPLLFERRFSTFLHHSIAAYGLVIIITVAAFVYLRLFDFSARPGGLVYFGAYLAVAIPLFIVFLIHGVGSERRQPQMQKTV